METTQKKDKQKNIKLLLARTQTIEALIIVLYSLETQSMQRKGTLTDVSCKHILDFLSCF